MIRGEADGNRLLEAIRIAQSTFILESSTASAFRGLLDELLELTDSEYGFIGEVEKGPSGSQLRVRAYTDIAWNETTRQLLRDSASTGLVFQNLDTLFGHAIKTGEVTIANDAANHPAAKGIPPGHPALNSFLGVPFLHGQEVIGMMGLANRPGGYTDQEVDFLQPLITTCGILIHSRRIAEEQDRSQQMEQEAERTQRLIEFSKKLAHDLNNLLTVTQATIDAFSISGQERMNRSDVDLIQLATKQAADLTHKILTFSGNSSIRRTAVDLGNVVHESAIVCQPVFPKHIRLSVEIADHLPPVLADADALQQALTNMIFNAIEATGNREGVVRIQGLREHERVVLQVSDDGVGMDSETQSRAFDPYFTTKVGARRGFGLASVLGFVKSHAAFLDVKSQPHEGTTIKISLQTAESSNQAKPSEPDFQFAEKRLLLVENDDAVRATLATLFQATGATVLSVASGTDALTLLNENQDVDLLISDVLMPGINGINLARELRSNGSEIPIVLLSGRTSDGLPSDLANDTKIAYLQKPFSIQQLRKVCDKIYDGR